MRIDVVTDRRIGSGRETYGREPGGPAEDAAGRELVRELAARGVTLVHSDGEDEQEVGPLPGAGSTPGGAAPAAEPAPEALLLAGSGNPIGPEVLADWFSAARTASGDGRRVVITGLALDDRKEPAPVLSELLSTACFAGFRDEVSRAVAARLCPGHPALHTGWDGVLLPPGPAGTRSPDDAARIVAALGQPPGPFAPEETAAVLAALLDALVHRTGGEVTVVAATGAARDARFCAAVAARLPEDVRCAVAPAGAAPEPLIAGAAHIVTTVRDGVALALAGGALPLPVAADAYAERGMQDVLDRWGLVEQVVPLAALLTPGEVAWDSRAAVQQWASEAVEHRAAVRAAIAGAAPAVASATTRWWDGVAEALRGGRPQGLPAPSLPPRGVGAPVVRALRRRYTVAPVPAERPAVAVVVLASGRPGAVHRVVEAVLEQTFTDWKLIVVGAGDQDARADALLGRHRDRLAGRGTVLHRRRMPGAGEAANRGLRAADSEFVMLVEDPGTSPPWPPTLLQRAVAHLEDPLVADDGVVVGTGEHSLAGGLRAAPGAAAVTLVELLRGQRAMPGPFLYRRPVHDVLGDYDETLARAGEWEFGLRFLETFTVGLVPGSGPLTPVRRSAGLPPDSRGDELLVRERHLKQWTAEHGIGLPLHLGRAVEEQAEALHRRLDDSEALARELLAVVRAQADRLEQLERTVAERGFSAFCRRWWHALTGR